MEDLRNSSVCPRRGLGKGESLFQQTMAACRDGDVAALSGCVSCQLLSAQAATTLDI